MILFSLIILCIFAIAFCFLFLTWMPTILFWLLLLLVVLFLFTQLIPILIIIAIVLGISYYRRKTKNEQNQTDFVEEVRQEDNAGEGSPFSHFQNRSVERIKQQFQDNHAFNLGDGLWVDQANGKLLIVTKGNGAGYLVADFDDVSRYHVVQPSDYSKTFSLQLDGLSEEKVTVTLSTQTNDWLQQSPADYFQELLSRYAQED
ncbi:hypothetical protein ACT5YR_02425 [Fructobacillus fructosus]|uniref:Uncharacterized protein n=1 Tax=Fructobacillus fructosus TaxID=1631 RepID=A0ABM9MR81_9LACO|nr:unnamed protein product [Fructobacillus fructosus]CAK1237021.1 unnamed protein product [Fructobacillus fructosus]